MMKTLCKSSKNKKVAGVCGGIAEYFNLDPSLVRLGFLVLCAVVGSGLLMYIVASIVMPDAPKDEFQSYFSNENYVEPPREQKHF